MARSATSEMLTPDQQAEADRIYSALVAAADEDIRALANQMASRTDATMFGDNEFTLRDIILRVAAKGLEIALEGRKRGYEGSSRSCEQCRESARFERWRSKTILTLVGSVRLSRAYYHCRHCGCGQFPRDGQLGLSACDLSRGAAQALTLTGTLASFAEAATKVLPKLTGLHASESTVERTTERAGWQVGKRLAAGEIFGPMTSWNWTKDTEGKTCAYVAADLTGVGMQGPGASATDGRMAAIGMIWNASEEGRVRYVSGLTGGLAALGSPLRQQGQQVGMDTAERWIALSDGGAGIEDWLRMNFPRVEAVILDFYHAAEHLCDWAKVLHPQQSEAERVGSEWCHRLKHEGAAVLKALREVNVSRRSAEVQEAHRQLLGYFENQVHRMDYPTYRSKGWLIGSGPVEAACKQVVNQRLKGSGMRWSESGADAVCHLRALFRSEKGQWDACWSSMAA